MSEQPRRDRDWEHWPEQRRPDEGIRHRLRGLFHPTSHGDEAVEELVALHGRELEERAAELTETVADLERREQRTHELRAAVEQMLRRGSAELDERHAELTELAARLAEREALVTDLEEALAERRRELGAVELRRAALERREAALTEHEEELARREAEIAERERALAEVEQRADELIARSADVAAREARLTQALEDAEAERSELSSRLASVQERERRADDVDARERDLAHARATLASREAVLEAEQADVARQRDELRRAVASVSAGLGLPSTDGLLSGEAAHVLFVPGDRYRLVAGDGPAPAAGDVVDVDERAYRVVRVGASPLPGDVRRCALLEPLPYVDSGGTDSGGR